MHVVCAGTSSKPEVLLTIMIMASLPPIKWSRDAGLGQQCFALMGERWEYRRARICIFNYSARVRACSCFFFVSCASCHGGLRRLLLLWLLLTETKDFPNCSLLLSARGQLPTRSYKLCPAAIASPCRACPSFKSDVVSSAGTTQSPKKFHEAIRLARRLSLQSKVFRS